MPDCKFRGLPGSMDYKLTRPRRRCRRSRPVHVSCKTCHARYDITATDVLQADATMVCKRCATSVTYPHGAVRVQCTSCGPFSARPRPGRRTARRTAHHRGAGGPRAPGELSRCEAPRRPGRRCPSESGQDTGATAALQLLSELIDGPTLSRATTRRPGSERQPRLLGRAGRTAPAADVLTVLAALHIAAWWAAYCGGRGGEVARYRSVSRSLGDDK